MCPGAVQSVLRVSAAWASTSTLTEPSGPSTTISTSGRPTVIISSLADPLGRCVVLSRSPSERGLSTGLWDVPHLVDAGYSRAAASRRVSAVLSCWISGRDPSMFEGADEFVRTLVGVLAFGVGSGGVLGDAQQAADLVDGVAFAWWDGLLTDTDGVAVGFVPSGLEGSHRSG